MRIGLIVDHPKRDLEGIVLVAYELMKRGADALIVPMYAQGADVPALGLDAVVVNYARPANRALLERYAGAGVEVYVLDTEGGVLAEAGGNSPSALAQAIRDGGYDKLLSGYFFWGDVLKEAFAAKGGLPPERLHVTGCPRFDLAAAPWRPILDGTRRGYVLVNANFPLVNPRFSASSGREREAMIAAGWDHAYVDRLLDDLRQIFPSYRRTIRDLAAARPQLDFLVRPHPFERIEPYHADLDGLSNVTIDGSGSALRAIHNSAVLLHLNCGTAVEAVMLGKLPVQMEFLNTAAAAGHAKLPAKVSRKVGSTEALLAVLDDIEDTTARFPSEVIYREHIFPFFHENDGRAAARVADVLFHELKRENGARPWRSLGASLMTARPSPSLGQLANGLVSVVLGSAAAGAIRVCFQPQRREKAFTPKEVENILKRLAAHESESSSMTRARRSRSGPLRLPLASISVTAG